MGYGKSSVGSNDLRAIIRCSFYLAELTFSGPSMPPKPSAIPVGTRIKMSELGAARCPRIAAKRGMVISRSRNPNTVWVRFDGNMSPTSLHRDYVEPIDAIEDTEQ